MNQQEFYKIVGLNPNKRIILYSPNGKIFTQSTFDQDIIYNLSHSIPSTHQLLIRTHPFHTEELGDVSKLNNVTVFTPHSQEKNYWETHDFSKADEDLIIDTIKYSDLLITVSTTLIIDMAVFNKPIILIDPIALGYASYRNMEDEHIQPILKGVKVAKSIYKLDAYIRELTLLYKT